jgi:hypothetical protein
MKHQWLVWTTGLSLGTAAGAVSWVVIDAATQDTSGLGLGLSVGLAVGVAHLWTAGLRKRRAWRAAEAAALSG